MRRRTLAGRGAGTLAVWAGEEIDYMSPDARAVPVVQPLVHGVSFAYADVDQWHAVGSGREAGHIYGRNTNPTVAAFERKLCALEDAEAAASFATGMAAISGTLFSLLGPGKRVVSIKESYGGTTKVMSEFLPAYGVDVALCDTDDEAAILAEVERGCDVLYLESPTNPTLKVLDLAKLCAAGRAAHATVVVDNTFATPINQNPLALGAHLVVHSATKYLGGHSDALGGVVCGDPTLVQRAYHFREINGASLSPSSAYLLLRGMKTLQLRVQRQNENALRIARWLDEHPRVTRVDYPGLPSHPRHELATKQMPGGFGGMMAFALDGGFDDVRAVLHRLQLAHLAASLGCVETLAAPPRTSSHVECSAEERAAMGIPEGLIRYSVGIEDADDLIDDLRAALDAKPTDL